MIRFNLICENDHEFDSWFADSKAFDDQQKAGFVTCPVCDSEKVTKSLMAPSISPRANSKASIQHPPQQMLAGSQDPAIREMIDAVRKMRRHVAENSEYVGKDFAKQAREMHYEEKPARGIYGEASAEEAVSLLEEGVEVMPLPPLPEDKN